MTENTLAMPHATPHGHWQMQIIFIWIKNGYDERRWQQRRLILRQRNSYGIELLSEEQRCRQGQDRTRERMNLYLCKNRRQAYVVSSMCCSTWKNETTTKLSRSFCSYSCCSPCPCQCRRALSILFNGIFEFDEENQNGWEFRIELHVQSILMSQIFRSLWSCVRSEEKRRKLRSNYMVSDAAPPWILRNCLMNNKE